MNCVTKVEKPELGANVGERIKYVRSNLLMSQKDLADKLGRQRTEISMFESGARGIDIYTLKEIAKIFNVSTDYLLGITDFESADINEIAINDLTGLSKGAIKNLVYLNKYHNGYLLSTINYLLEQEQVFPEEYYIRQTENKNNISDEQLAKAFKDFVENENKRIITYIDNYFKVKIEKEEEFYITIPSIEKQKEVTDLYDYATTKGIVASNKLADMVLLKEIEKLLESAKANYLTNNKRNED